MFVSTVGMSSLWLVSLVGAAPGLPLGLPPAEENPLMARVAPDQCIAYLSWASSTTPDPENKNQTERLLAEPEVPQFVAGLEQLVTDLFGRQGTYSARSAQRVAGPSC